MGNELRINICGDFSAKQEVYDYVQNETNSENLFGDLLDLLDHSDLNVVNPEYPFTSSNIKATKYGSVLKGHPDCFQPIKKAKFNLLSLANNHILDYGIEGLKETIGLCRKNNIDFVGAGVNYEEARKPYYFEANGKTVAILNYAENEFNTAKANMRGGANPIDIVENVRDIKAAKKRCDYVIVIFHGGNEFIHYPSLRLQNQCRFYAENGADFIVGHHTHYVSGYEVYNGVPIIYSLGNLFYPLRKPKEWKETVIVNITIDEEGLKYKFIPFRLNLDAFKLEKMQGDVLEEFEGRFSNYSKVLKEPELLHKKWSEGIKKVEINYLSLLLGVPYIARRITRRLKLESLLLKFLKVFVKRYLIHLNLVRCEAHQDAIIELLDKERHDS
ncbi:CapA family protein [Prolixibacteraceae bacterium JC049]|nr:CapA family protein [Prolixibacteraceae bacterium JC049]